MAGKLIQRFCANKDDPRRYLHHPFAFNTYVCATDGYTMVFTPADAAGESDALPCSASIQGSVRRLLAIYHNLKESDFGPVPEIVFPSVIETTCAECDGLGEVSFENEQNDYQFTCKTCDGAGSLSAEPKVNVPGFNLIFGASQLKRILELPELSVANAEQYMAFRFTGGFGLCYSAFI